MIFEIIRRQNIDKFYFEMLISVGKKQNTESRCIFFKPFTYFLIQAKSYFEVLEKNKLLSSKIENAIMQ